MANSSWICPVVLEGRVVRLEPLELRHARGLLAAADPSLFRFTHQAPDEWSLAGFEANVRRFQAMEDVVPLAVVDRESGQVLGRTTFMSIRPPHRALEIGYTWITRERQGTRVNPEMKCLMLRHAFETLQPTALRVQFATGASNEHSQRAIAKLGAVREGTLRCERILPDGSSRDTVLFSVIHSEWPAVKAGLERRLAASE